METTRENAYTLQSELFQEMNENSDDNPHVESKPFGTFFDFKLCI